MDSFRKQLDALMGANRNGDVQEVQRKFSDRDVCRLYLAGLCPHDLFQLTRMDLGVCPKIHSLQLRKEYNEQTKQCYNRELEECLEKHVLECDRKIQRALKRIEEDDVNAATAIAVSEVTRSSEALEYTRQIKEKLRIAENLELEGKTDDKIRVMGEVEALRSTRADRQALSLLEAFNKDRALLLQGNAPPLAPLPYMPFPPDARTQDMIKEKLNKAEVLGEQGLVDEAQKTLEEAEALKKLVSRYDMAPDPNKVLQQDARATDQKLRVCDICGAYLSIYDSDRRLADHFGGKLHLGYMRIREKLGELREEKEKARKLAEEKARERALASKEPDERENDRRERRERSYRDRERERDRDRGYMRERGRRRSRSPSRERIRERSRDLSPRDVRRSHW
ncbi:U1 snRNP-associated protein usp106 [Selaginella moellendorffii]|uniref:U1 snRNP-associated protein usp106 n=1 Tax=Selaginella moellendorffii TaxID=88036 RepID=UPI000D1C5EB6|nr:U1 snRNP-associated protein usp106 [Selaginella moellendorffii]|eukprot:XP_002987146.2 U1 snRNP-associated protein usp106 [Selaginella moellendorffii]